MKRLLAESLAENTVVTNTQMDGRTQTANERSACWNAAQLLLVHLINKQDKNSLNSFKNYKT